MYKELWSYFKRYQKLIILCVFLSTIAAATDAGLAYIVKPTLDYIFIAKNKTYLFIIPICLVALYILKSVLRFVLNYTLRYVGQKVLQIIRNDLYKKIIYLPIRFFSDNSTGILMSRITNDVNMMQTSIPTIVSIIRDFLSISALIGVIFFMNTKMAFIAMAVYPIFIHPFILISKRIRRYSKKGQEHMGFLTSILQETFSGVRVVKAFAQETREVKRFSKVNEDVVKASLKASLAAEFTSPMMEVVSSFGIAGIVFYGGLQVINGEITTGTFFSFLAAVAMVYEPVKRLGNSNATIQQALASAERVFEILNVDNEILNNNGSKLCNAADKNLEFKNVYFTYDPDEPHVLKDISFNIPYGLTVAFVGHSGAGKSTIANLIPRFYDVTEGSITIGGVDIRDYQVHSLRKNVSYVSQEPFLFDDTILNNIAYTNESTTKQEIVDAAKAAYAHDFIMSLPSGYDTVIGERGVRLSGGQKQRLTIARALLKNSPILILDEATSSLDTESEREVQNALDNLMKGRTSLIIAHRLSTIINADMIILLEEGKIVSVGTHNELLDSSEIYKRLYKNQAQIY